MEIQAKNKINEDYVADLTGANYKKKSPAVTKQLRFLKGIWREERIKWDSANDDKQLLDKVVQVAKIVTKLRGKINHIHLIDSDGTLHDDETSTHAPFGTGILDFDALLPELNRAGVPHDWWTIDLCFWPDAWAVTAECKKAVDALNEKYG